jgi:hypothetical protein
MDFSVLVQMTNRGTRSFPLSGLQELEPDWQETVIDLIASPPVNQILKISTYTPFSAESVPMASIEKPPFASAA